MKKTPILPKALRPGDAVAVVAPSGPISPEKLEVGLDFLRSWKLEPVVFPHVLDRAGYLAGSDEDRLADLTAAFSDPGIAGIFCARGGYGTMRFLPRLDVDLIEAHPKVFVGFSDITVLQMIFRNRAALPTFSAPMIAGTQIAHITEGEKEHYHRLLFEPKYRGLLPGRGRALKPGKARGLLFGGNLTMLIHLAAIGELPDLRDAILLIEDVNEPPYRIDRALTTLKLAGKLAGVRGILAGQFVGVDPTESGRILLDILGGLSVPIIGDFPIGHGERNVAVPFGIPVEIDAAKGCVSILEGAVC